MAILIIRFGETELRLKLDAKATFRQERSGAESPLRRGDRWQFGHVTVEVQSDTAVEVVQPIIGVAVPPPQLPVTSEAPAQVVGLAAEAPSVPDTASAPTRLQEAVAAPAVEPSVVPARAEAPVPAPRGPEVIPEPIVVEPPAAAVPLPIAPAVPEPPVDRFDASTQAAPIEPGVVAAEPPFPPRPAARFDVDEDMPATLIGPPEEGAVVPPPEPTQLPPPQPPPAPVPHVVAAPPPEPVAPAPPRVATPPPPPPRLPVPPPPVVYGEPVARAITHPEVVPDREPAVSIVGPEDLTPLTSTPSLDVGATLTPSSLGAIQKTQVVDSLALPKLIITLDNVTFEHILFRDSTRIGRDATNDLCLPDTSVSRYHCSITKDAEGGFVAKDLNSTNGTIVNEVQIESVTLKTGDEIELGNYRIKFIWDIEKAAQAAEPPTQDYSPLHHQGSQPMLPAPPQRPAGPVPPPVLPEPGVALQPPQWPERPPAPAPELPEPKKAGGFLSRLFGKDR